MDTVAGSASGALSRDRGRWRDSVWWQVAVGVAAVAAGVVAVWVTLPADFLRYPAWLAAQKADFVIGPVLTGLYWMRQAPAEPVRPDADLLGGRRRALHPPVVQRQLAVLDRPVLGEGLRAGHLRPHPGVPHRALGPAVEGRAGRRCRHACCSLAVAIQLVLPQVGAGGSISSCRSLCPHNELAFTSDPALALDLFEVFSYAVLALALAVAAVVVHRFVTGTPPRRRALAIGTPVALLFLLCEILYQLLDDRGRRGQRAVRHRHLGVRGRPRGRLVRLPVRVDRRRAVRRARDGAAGRAVAGPPLQAGARGDAARAARRSAAPAAVPSGPRHGSRCRASGRRGGPRA